MAKSDTQFAGSIPAIYDRLMVPITFGRFAIDMAERVAKLGPERVLEVAAGTGAVTREMAARLPAKTHITATDLNPSMLDAAKARQGVDARITWQQADALALPFAGKSFDAVVCQFGVMFFPDRVKGYREALRVLKPKGVFLFDAWDRISENHFAFAISETLKTIYPDDPPDFMARTPHGYHDPALIESDLREAGFTSIEIDLITHAAHAASAEDAATAWCQGTPLRNEIELRGEPKLERVTEVVAGALEKRFGTGPIQGKITAHIVTAKR
jgi:SAM-dependent methyltransferase